MTRPFFLSVSAHAALVAIFLGWRLLLFYLPPPHPITPPQVEIVVGDGGTPTQAVPPPAPATQAQTPSPAATPTKPTDPTPSDQPAPAQPPTQSTTPSPAAPPPAPSQVRLNAGDGAAVADLLDPTLVRRATVDSGNVPPVYPSDSVAAHERGLVRLRLHVAADGSVAQAEIALSSGSPRLDKAALDSVSTWHFHPGLRDGIPVADVIEMGIEFRLP